MLAHEPATTLRLPEIKARLLSGSTLGKARALFCAFAVLSATGVIVPIMAADQDLALRISGAAAAAALGAHWFIGWRLGRFPLAGEPSEVLALFLALRVAPGHPFLPMCGLLLRSTYCGYPLALLRWAAWSGTIIAAAAIGHLPSVDDAVAWAFALVIIPLILPGFRNALVRLESSEERLQSLIENSTDVVTVLGDDLRISWQAQSIKAVLGHDAGDWLGTRFSEHVHPDDRGKLADFAERAHDHPGYSRLLELRLRAADGHVRWFEIAASARSPAASPTTSTTSSR
jgi:PAS domain S-box-containing protein